MILLDGISKIKKSPPFEGGVARSAGVVASGLNQPPRCSLSLAASPPSKGGDFLIFISHR
jgi:hypothetical protein